LTDKKKKSPLHLIIQLTEGGLGDPERLNRIKKSLENSQQLSESDKQYLEELGEQLPSAVKNLVTKLEMRAVTLQVHKKENKTEKEDIEQSTIPEKLEEKLKINWTLELIKELNDNQVGEFERLNRIKISLEKKEAVSEDDKKYLKDKARHLKTVLESRTKLAAILAAIMKLQEIESRHSQRLLDIRRAIEQGIVVTPRDLRYLTRRYEKFVRALDQEDKVEWTIQRIDKLLAAAVGDSQKINEIKELLEDEAPVPEEDVKYLRQKHQLLAQITNNTRKIESAIGIIEKLLEKKVGNQERLDGIKKKMEERSHLSSGDINYLKRIYQESPVQRRQEKDDKTEKVDFNSILDELESIMDESKVLHRHYSPSLSH
jgi:hypothetical protein